MHVTISIIRGTCAQSSTFALLMSRTTTESANTDVFCKVDFTFAKKYIFYLHISKKSSIFVP